MRAPCTADGRVALDVIRRVGCDCNEQRARAFGHSLKQLPLDKIDIYDAQRAALFGSKQIPSLRRYRNVNGFHHVGLCKKSMPIVRMLEGGAQHSVGILRPYLPRKRKGREYWRVQQLWDAASRVQHFACVRSEPKRD